MKIKILSDSPKNHFFYHFEAKIKKKFPRPGNENFLPYSPLDGFHVMKIKIISDSPKNDFVIILKQK